MFCLVVAVVSSVLGSCDCLSRTRWPLQVPTFTIVVLSSCFGCRFCHARYRRAARELIIRFTNNILRSNNSVPTGDSLTF